MGGTHGWIVVVVVVVVGFILGDELCNAGVTLDLCHTRTLRLLTSSHPVIIAQ